MHVLPGYWASTNSAHPAFAHLTCTHLTACLYTILLPAVCCSAWFLPAGMLTPAAAPPHAWPSVPLTRPLVRATTVQAGWLWARPQGLVQQQPAAHVAGTSPAHWWSLMRLQACWQWLTTHALATWPAAVQHAVSTKKRWLCCLCASCACINARHVWPLHCLLTALLLTCCTALPAVIK
jgi:hypothetical protein